ncbi:MAG: GNAT family N-acetyltransferase [Candidatus Eremiobacteraeota bacterium]|nr:GNAT family N-acetyltransferase [Candidatus Eremiobacteraeota bacterium]MBV9057063.1 GNAT family N-acetyltransferase [Candidatus Eremiobacteraeota bacterium]MBV9699766.1 GNAT family N-acetyltransferase [Candidatus Eremiobacteraeota bacterium]
MARRDLGLEVARATSEDASAIAPLFHLYREFFAGAQDEATSSGFVSERLRLGDSVIFVAKNGERAVGFVQLYPLWSSWYCEPIWFLSDLYVEKSARKRGIGAGLVQRVVEHARETHARSIMVELPRREPHLTEFYARLGFTADEIFELARFRLRSE